MIAYKLLKKRNNGTLGPLFINRRQIIPIGIWLDAELNPTKGYAVRKGWHCTLKPSAPHLSEKGRVWAKVELEDFSFFDRPESQGGKWVLGQRMKILELL